MRRSKTRILNVVMAKAVMTGNVDVNTVMRHDSHRFGGRNVDQWWDTGDITPVFRDVRIDSRILHR